MNPVLIYDIIDYPTHGLIDCRFDSPHQPSFEFILEPIGVAADVNGIGVVDDPIQDHCGNYAVAEHLTPGAIALV